MHSTDGNFSITAEKEDNKRLLVLHKSSSGSKVATQAGESTDAVLQRRCGSQRPATPTASRFSALLCSFLRLTPFLRLVS